MVLFINNSCDSNSDHYFLNCYLKKNISMINFFFSISSLIFNFIGIELYDFSKLGASSLITQVTSLIKLIYFLKGIFFLFLIELFQSYNIDPGLDEISHVNLTLIIILIYLSWMILYIFYIHFQYLNIIFHLKNSLASPLSGSNKDSYCHRHKNPNTISICDKYIYTRERHRSSETNFEKFRSEVTAHLNPR
jgi:hypothetical protein